jgi:uncharacterized protein DUF11
LVGVGKLRARRFVGASLAAAIACLAIPAAGQAAANDVGVSQKLSTTKAKPGKMIQVTSTVTNLGTQPATDARVELAALKGKILVFGANDPYTSFSSSQGSCATDAEQGITTGALVCALGTLAPGQSAQVHATVRVRESAVQTTTLLPPLGGNEYSDDVKSNDARSQPFFLDVPPKVRGSKALKLMGLPRSCVSGDFTLTVVSKAPGTKKMKVKADLGFNPRNGHHLLISRKVNGARIKIRIPASKAETQIDEGNFPSYSVIVKAKSGGHTLTTKVEFKRC